MAVLIRYVYYDDGKTTSARELLVIKPLGWFLDQWFCLSPPDRAETIIIT